MDRLLLVDSKLLANLRVGWSDPPRVHLDYKAKATQTSFTEQEESYYHLHLDEPLAQLSAQAIEYLLKALPLQCHHELRFHRLPNPSEDA
jgi:hypothetical protein